MKKKDFLSIAELAEILGISRIAVYKKVKTGLIKAIRIGRSYAIPSKGVADLLGVELGPQDKQIIDRAVDKTVKEYGEVLKMLGNE
jgi:excisionase family DNA binding protein